jgi:hypothetical protein
MSYTGTEITNIKRLVADADLKNLLLAFEIVKGRGLVQELLTEIYWIYNRMIWAGEKQSELKVYEFIRQYLSKDNSSFIMPPFLLAASKSKLKIHPDTEEFCSSFNINNSEFTKLFYDFFPSGDNPVNRFLIKYGSHSIQQKIIPYLKKREHTGHFMLDMGGFKLKTVPEAILTANDVHKIKLWGNELKELPDIWEQFGFLEVLNIEDNQLKTFPPSFVKLGKLRKLYAQNNCFNVSHALQTIKQLPEIRQITIKSEVSDKYSNEENEILRQFEELVNHGIIHESEKEQLLFTGILMNNNSALQKLTLFNLFEALSHKDEAIRRGAKSRILNWEGSVYPGNLPQNACVAILGIVSFAIRNKLIQKSGKINYTTEIDRNTTHIVIGDYPENYEEIQNRSFIFMTESDL